MPFVAVHMTCDEMRLQLAHEHADPGGPRRDLDSEQLLDGQGVDELVVERREIVHPGHVRGALDVGELLARLLHPGVEVSDDWLGTEDGLAFELEHDPQHAVGRGVLGAHVDDHRLVFAELDVEPSPGLEDEAVRQAEDAGLRDR